VPFFMSKIFLMYRFILLFFFFPLSVFASENKLPQISGVYQFSFENIVLPGSEDLGLLGGNYLVENNNWYAGLGVYGAVSGDRGGFFIGGLHVGKTLALSSGYYLEGNAYLGGGGGGSAPQGGGLMLRAATGLGKQIADNRYFLGVSRVSFPNGDINSNQISLAYSRKFSSLHFAGWGDSSAAYERWKNDLKGNKAVPQQASLQILNYYPGASVKGRDSRLHEKVLSVLGARFSQKLGKLLWGEFETAGAMSGGIDGFAQVLGGLSLKQAFYKNISISGGWLLGAAGGGNVDTGGGVITRIYSGVELAFTQRWSSKLDVGYITALDGGFSANTVNFNLAYRFDNISPERLFSTSAKSRKIIWRKLRIRPGAQRYTLYARNARKFQGQKDFDVDLTNLKLDAFVSPKIFFTGQALGAFKGKAGGYAVGLIGPGVQFNQYIGAEFLAGVAGGGGIAVGSGKIVQPMLNLTLPYDNRWSTELSAGYVKAVDDKLSAFVFNLGLVYHFVQPYY